jgi:hypothetical protein
LDYSIRFPLAPLPLEIIPIYIKNSELDWKYTIAKAVILKLEQIIGVQ